MVIKENNWIGTHQGDMVVQNPSCINNITMVIMFVGFKAYNPTILTP